MRIADVVAITLANHGVHRAFGMPGGEVVTLIDALAKAGIKFTLARNETAAAIMAAGASSATGRPGLLVTTVGPGLTNALNGIADASQEHAPVIVISGVVDHAIRDRYTHQVLDQRATVRSLVKASFEIEAVGAGAVVGRAIDVACSPPYGPVHLDLAPETANLPANAGDGPAPAVKPAWPKVAESDADIKSVWQTLARADRPLIIVGAEGCEEAAGNHLLALMERLHIPLITTYKAKGVAPERHTLSLGAAGLSPIADRILLPLVKRADVVLLAGYDPIEMRQAWLNPFSASADVIELSRVIVAHGMHRATRRLVGPVGQILEALATTRLIERRRASPEWSEEVAEAQAALQEAFRPPDTWGPHAVIRTLEEEMPDGCVVTVDSGAHRILLSQSLRMESPNRLLQSAGFCTMGAALPLAIGYKIERSATPVVAVVGDGGLEMTLGELGTLRDEGLPVVILAFQDSSLALIELKQRQAGLSRIGVRLGATEYEKIAKAFGGAGVRVSRVGDLQAALRAAFARASFTVIVAEIAASDYADRI